MASKIAAAKPRDKPKGPRVISKTTGKALVKGVVSGDTLLIVGSSKPGEGPPPEKEVTLSGIRAPTLIRGKNSAKSEEGWAWWSREFLRKKVLGKPITFQVVHHHEPSGRDYCNVQFNGEELSHIIVANGWASVNQPPLPEGKKPHPEKQVLLNLENDAKIQGLGMHNKSVSAEQQIREIDWVDSVSEFYEHKKNIPLPAIVDKVITGSVLRVEVLGDETDPLKHYIFNLHLAGVECPETPVPDSVLKAQNQRRKEEDPKWQPPKKKKPAPFAIEAQKFVENRLLHRDIKVVIQGCDKQALFGTIQFEKGNISEKLLEQGLGKLVKWTSNLTGAGDRLAAIEGEAKKRKAGQWHSYQEGDDDVKGAEHAEITTKIIQVVSGDRIIASGDKRYALASIRAPRFGARGDPGEPLGFEAREELRKQIIGKTVRVVVEYEREPPVDSKFTDKQVFVSLYHGKININEYLVEKGLAQVMHHKRNENRAANYERLVEKEQKAKREGRGIWAETIPTPRNFTDLTQNFRPRPVKQQPKEETEETEEGAEDEEEKKEVKQRRPKSQARGFLDRLKQNRQIGIVEYVFSATRYKILIDGQGLYISFALSGIRSPPQKNEDGGPNVYSQMALEFAKERLLQRTVYFDVKDIDRGDNFLGTLSFQGAKDKRESIGSLLLQNGLAFTFGSYSNPVPPALAADEKIAKDSKLNWWKDYKEPEPEEDTGDYQEDIQPEADAGDEKEATEQKQQHKRGRFKEETVRVTEVIDAATFYIHVTTDDSIREIEEQMKVFDGTTAATPSEEDVKSGTFAGLFRNDGSWHRVRIEGKSAGGKLRAFFIDYGNRDVLDLEDVRVLDDDLAKLPGTALACVLTALKAPGERSEYFERAGQAFSDLVWDRQLTAKFDFVDGGKFYVTLKQPGSDLSINQRLLQAGCVRIQDRFPRDYKFKPLRDIAASLREQEENAKRHRRGIWEYGDVSDEEEDGEESTRYDGRVPSKAAKEKAEKDKIAKKEKEKELAAIKKKADEEKAKSKGDKGGKDKGKGGDKGGDKGKGDKGGKKK